MPNTTAASWVRFHLAMTTFWALMLIPTLIWWKDSILWVAGMSLYANVVGHFSAWQAARAESASNGERVK